eukprot:1869855-Pleurochrysis_carterae.AAC.1
MRGPRGSVRLRNARSGRPTSSTRRACSRLRVFTQSSSAIINAVTSGPMRARLLRANTLYGHAGTRLRLKR